MPFVLLVLSSALSSFRKNFRMGKALLTFACLVAAMALLGRHYHHVSMSVVLFSTAILSAVFGVLLFNRHPLEDLLEVLHRQAD